MKTLYKYSALVLVAWAVLAAPAFAQDVTPGTEASIDAIATTQKSVAAKVLAPAVAETGLISASIDGCGSNEMTCPIDVDKPAGATVRAAFFSASTFGFVIPDGLMTIDGTAVDWDEIASASFLRSYGADVTSIVKPIVDAAPAGIVTLTIGEGDNTRSIDGSSLVVIFDDPNVSTTSTVVTAFGGQELGGDSFSITLAEPFDDATQDITMSLAIGFGFQVTGGPQRSLIDVNGQRLTSSAGGQDDCVNAPNFSQCPNGTLYTVGGIGDDPANPTDPNAGPSDPRTDDELYTLDPFIGSGATNILVETENPSFDDIVHMAVFIIEGSAAIVNEDILLTPTDATNSVGTDHTVTAFVQDDDGNPIAGREVDFEITAGPNSGLMASATTDASGEATFTWSSSAAGTDIVVASTVDSEGDPLISNEAQKTWVTESECDMPTLGENIVNEAARTVTNTMEDQEGIQSFTFSVLDNFTVASIAPMAGFTRSGNTWTWTGAGDPPVAVNFVLQAASPSGKALYFLEATDACDPPNTTDFDPPIDLGPDAALAFGLADSYPNPTRGAATVSFSLSETSPVTLAVYDVMGRKVATLVDEAVDAGQHEVRWNGRSADGSAVASGVYLLRLEAGDRVATRRLTVVR